MKEVVKELWLVTFNYICGQDYGCDIGLVGVYDTAEQAYEAKKQTARRLQESMESYLYVTLDDILSYFDIKKIIKNHTYTSKVSEEQYEIPEISLGGYLE